MIEHVIDLSRNEFLFDHPVVREVMPQLTAKEICKYSQKPQLLEALSNHHDVDPDCITLFNGAEHALRAIFSTVSRLQGATLFLLKGGTITGNLQTVIRLRQSPMITRKMVKLLN